jgi:hypothetical protein
MQICELLVVKRLKICPELTFALTHTMPLYQLHLAHPVREGEARLARMSENEQR